MPYEIIALPEDLVAIEIGLSDLFPKPFYLTAVIINPALQKIIKYWINSSWERVPNVAWRELGGTITFSGILKDQTDYDEIMDQVAVESSLRGVTTPNAVDIQIKDRIYYNCHLLPPELRYVSMGQQSVLMLSCRITYLYQYSDVV